MNAPTLRFEGDINSWTRVALGELLSFNNGINADKGSYGHGRKFINVLDILNNDFITYNKIIGSVSVSSQVEARNKVEYGDILFLRSSETREDVGKSSVYLDSSDYALYGGFVIRGKKIAEYNPYFLKLNLETSNIRKQIGSKAGGSTRFNVSQGILSSVEINLPKLEEQEKIADFFALINQRIEKQREKLAFLQVQKKGIIQQIFNQDLKFKGKVGQDYKEWKKVSFKECFEHTGGTALEKYVKPDGTHKFISIGSYGENGYYNDQNLRVDLNEKTSNKLLNKDDLVMVLNDKTAAGNIIGSVLLIESDNLYVYNQRSERLVCRDNIIPKYAWYFLNSFYFRKNIISMAQGGTQIYVNYSNVEKINFQLPSILEQKMIIGLLDKIEGKIILEEEKLTSLETQKSAFMQYMFV